MNIFRIQNRCFLRFWSWRSRRFRTKRRNEFACSQISSSCPPCYLLWFSREHNARVHLTFLLNEMYGYSWLCDRLWSSAIRNSSLCDHMETSLKGLRSKCRCTRLPPMRPEFDFQTRRHVWVEFVGFLFRNLWEAFPPSTAVFPSPPAFD